jgi:hypothetical protein
MVLCIYGYRAYLAHNMIIMVEKSIKLYVTFTRLSICSKTITKITVNGLFYIKHLNKIIDECRIRFLEIAL